MATYTSNYNLKKPDGTDYVNIQDINGNMDIIDEKLKAAESRSALDELANNTGNVTIQGAGANSVNAVNLCQKNTAYSDMIQTLEMNSMNGPPGRLFRMLIKQGNNPNGTEGTDYGGLRLFTNWTQKSGSLEPLINNAYSLGNSSQKWSAVYATNGTIQTSDVREKSDVKKIPQGANNSAAVMRALSANETEAQDVTYDDIIDFLKNIDIYTYVSDPTRTETVQDAISANQFDKIHVGIMANDIVDSKLFPFVAYKNTEDENAILGMKYESLGVLALYAIRDLYSKIEALKAEVAQLKRQIKL